MRESVLTLGIFGRLVNRLHECLIYLCFLFADGKNVNVVRKFIE